MGQAGDFYNFISDPRNRRKIPHRMGECGYVSVHNDGRKDRFWLVGGKPQVIYVKIELTVRDRQIAAAKLARESTEPSGSWDTGIGRPNG